MEKTIIVIVLVLIVASMGQALYYMVKDKGRKPRTVKALTVRIILSLLLFIGLIVAMNMGLITPNPHPIQ